MMIGRCDNMQSAAFEFLKELYGHNRTASEDPHANRSDDRSVQLVARIIFDEEEVESAIENLEETVSSD